MIKVKHYGNFNKTERFFKRNKKFSPEEVLREYGHLGVLALSSATPRKTGKTAESWTYEVTHEGDRIVLSWSNTNTNEWANVALLLQYGHATRNGGYVAGTDYINPALAPIIQKLSEAVWKEVTK